MESAVALISMPFFMSDRPSLGLSLLKSGLATQGIDCTVYYLNIMFEEMIGPEVAALLDDTSTVDLIQEWIFAEAFWGPDPSRDRRYIYNVVKGRHWAHRIYKKKAYPDDLVNKIWHCREQVDRFFKRCLDVIPWQQYGVVGFSSKFQQNLASLTLARLLKTSYPNLITVFGGFNCQDQMGIALLRNFPFVDAVCTGEGDIVFPQFVYQRLIQGATDHIPGMLHRSDTGNSELTGMHLVNAMDQLPYPDFDDFFTQRLRIYGRDSDSLVLAIEGSRGCWWGEKAHCTFCGLNGKTLNFRCKSPQRFIEEIKWMLAHYGRYTQEIHAVDCILPKTYLKEVLPALAEFDPNVKMFYEVKANLEKQDIAQCKDAGLVTFQPGIESLVTRHLNPLKKGSMALQNIQLLKWCLQYGVHPGWNYLIGIPGEKVEDYVGQSDLIPALHHLPPPHPPGCHRIRFDRFSPYVSEPEKHGLRDLAPYPSYSYVYPKLDTRAVMDLAYFFTADFEAQMHIEEYADDIGRAVQGWISSYQETALFSLDVADALVIVDFRDCAAQMVHILTGTARRVYEACDQIRSRNYLKQILSSKLGKAVDEAQFDAIISPLLQARLLIREKDRYLGLAVPLGYNYFPPEATWSRLASALSIIQTLDDCAAGLTLSQGYSPR